MIRALWLVEKGDGKTTMNEVRWPATAEAYLPGQEPDNQCPQSFPGINLPA
ncbi:hypothetical protein NUKP43_30000 [Klebsiella quasipneumoniae]|nr:hypothetical protein NUKP43_30000 [Klebsiella quasipneumoniae]